MSNLSCSLIDNFLFASGHHDQSSTLDRTIKKNVSVDEDDRTRTTAYSSDDEDLSHQQVEVASDPLPFEPLDFSSKQFQCQLVHNVSAFDTLSQSTRMINNVLISSSTNKVYWIRRTLRKAIYGSVCLAHVLDPVNDENGYDYEVNVTQKYAIKLMEWKCIKSKLNIAEDPLKEIAAMNYVEQFHDDNRNTKKKSHVLSPVEVLSNRERLFVVLPYCRNGDLFDRLEQHSLNSKNSDSLVSEAARGFQEVEAKYWMRQILHGMQSMKDAGVCHRDLSLENVLIDGKNAYIMDLGMALRVPGSKDKSTRMKPQGACGKLQYMSPEIYLNEASFDGFASDVWSAGIILFMMLVGAPAFEIPHFTDRAFLWISRGKLRNMLEAWNVQVSDEAIDLLENVLIVDPSKRITLEEFQCHPWFR